MSLKECESLMPERTRLWLPDFDFVYDLALVLLDLLLSFLRLIS